MHATSYIYDRIAIFATSYNYIILLSSSSNITNQFWFCMVTQNVIMLTDHVVHESFKTNKLNIV